MKSDMQKITFEFILIQILPQILTKVTIKSFELYISRNFLKVTKSLFVKHEVSRTDQQSLFVIPRTMRNPIKSGYTNSSKLDNQIDFATTGTFRFINERAITSLVTNCCHTMCCYDLMVAAFPLKRVLITFEFNRIYSKSSSRL